MKTDNELIAEFMGMRIEKTTTPSGKDWYRGFCFYPAYKTAKEWTCGASSEKQVKESLKAFEHNYDTSWDWIMPVVEKIETIKFGSYRFKVQITSNECRIFSYVRFTGMNDIDLFYTDVTKLQSINGAVLKFIKWHKEQ